MASMFLLFTLIDGVLYNIFSRYDLNRYDVAYPILAIEKGVDGHF